MLFDDINEVRVMGNMTQDPDLRFTPSGSAVMNFSVATNRSYKSGDEWKEEVTFHNVVVWGNLAQQLSTRVKKGTRVMLSGRIQTRSWDGTDGKKNYKTELIADNVILIDRYNKNSGDGASESSNSSAPQNQGQGKQDFDPSSLGMKTADKVNNVPEDAASATIDPDDLPF